MDKKLRLAVFLFFMFLLVFIAIVIYSEYKNMDRLKIEYPDLSNESYELRKDSLRVWAIKLILQFLIPFLF